MSTIIIPVIDLLDGQVVHARGGRRSEYAPVCSALCPSSEPAAVLAALLALQPFSVVYVADLGALLGRERHDAMLEELRAEFPGITFWVDCGERQPAANRTGMRSIIGTETGISAAALGALTASGADFILSLDFSAAGVIGDAEILARPECWPRDVIIMNLPSVGTAKGPAWMVVDDVMRRATNRNFYLAGGVRDSTDVAQSITRGMRGALVATALHTGTLDLSHFGQAKKTPA
jgi:phosphoribosylformimino-5-aminoimidazole carboxamide ribotide isomerase